MGSGNNGLRLYPEDLRATASALNGLSGDTDQVQQRLDSSWGRLDSGYDPAQNKYGFLDPGVDKPAIQWLTEAELKDQWWYDPVHPMWIVEERKQ